MSQFAFSLTFLQYLVDWSKAMVPQIPKITKHYSEWVNKPVDRRLRLFDPPWLENLTKTPWWVVPTFWLPTICYIFSIGKSEAHHQNYSNVSITIIYFMFF